MHRPGADLAAMLPTDILCDFCARPWQDDIAMVEGHRVLHLRRLLATA